MTGIRATNDERKRTRIYNVHANINVFVNRISYTDSFIYGFAYVSISFKLTPNEPHGERISKV